MRELAQADAAETELAKDGARPSAPLAAPVVADAEALRARRLRYERLLRHLVRRPVDTVPILAREKQAGQGRRERAYAGHMGATEDTDRRRFAAARACCIRRTVH